MPAKSQLVCQQLENISRDALSKYQNIIRAYIKGRNGVYALYKGEKLYYVGLATNLRGRLKSHLRDRHGESWDRFSVYLTIGDSHLKEMESLLLRIARPSGNRQIGKFVKCENLKTRFTADVKTLQREELFDIIGRRATAQANGSGTADERHRAVLALYDPRPSRIKGQYKGKTFRASVRRDGTIHIGRRSFNSPSLAAVHCVGRQINGWWFWKYERAPGDWVRLRELRR